MPASAFLSCANGTEVSTKDGKALIRPKSKSQPVPVEPPVASWDIVFLGCLCLVLQSCCDGKKYTVVKKHLIDPKHWSLKFGMSSLWGRGGDRVQGGLWTFAWHAAKANVVTSECGKKLVSSPHMCRWLLHPSGSLARAEDRTGTAGAARAARAAELWGHRAKRASAWSWRQCRVQVEIGYLKKTDKGRERTWKNRFRERP